MPNNTTAPSVSTETSSVRPLSEPVTASTPMASAPMASATAPSWETTPDSVPLSATFPTLPTHETDAASPATPGVCDYINPADSANAHYEARMSSRVVVTSRDMAVDTDQLVAAATAAADVVQHLSDANWAVYNAIHLGDRFAHLAPAETAAFNAVAQEAHAAVGAARDSVQQWLDSLSYAAMVYAGAEGDAQAFNSVWQLVGQGSTALGGGTISGPGAADGNHWYSGFWGLHGPSTQVNWGLSALIYALTGGTLKMPGAVFDAIRVGAATIPIEREFVGHSVSDAGLLFRTQMDADQAAQMIASKRGFLGRPIWGNPASDHRDTWWGTTHEGTTAAAAKTALGSRILSGLVTGIPAGMSVVGYVPAGLVNPGTGRPIRWSLSETVTASAASRLAPDNPAPTPRSPQRVRTPTQASALLGRISQLESNKEYGQFEILRHQTGAKTSWSVVIRGTQVWGVNGRNAQDMLTNLQEVGGVQSDQTAAIKQAMGQMGIKPGDAVEITGHSQGGIVAAQLASDPQVNQKYRVVSVLTAGSPTAAARVPDTTRMLNVENGRDIVPALDGSANPDLGQSVTVHFDGGMIHAGEGAGPHDISTYQGALEWIEHDPKPSREVTQWASARNAELGFSDQTETTSFLFNTARLHGPGIISGNK